MVREHTRKLKHVFLLHFRQNHFRQIFFRFRERQYTWTATTCQFLRLLYTPKLSCHIFRRRSLSLMPCQCCSFQKFPYQLDLNTSSLANTFCSRRSRPRLLDRIQIIQIRNQKSHTAESWLHWNKYQAHRRVPIVSNKTWPSRSQDPQLAAHYHHSLSQLLQHEIHQSLRTWRNYCRNTLGWPYLFCRSWARRALPICRSHSLAW